VSTQSLDETPLSEDERLTEEIRELSDGNVVDIHHSGPTLLRRKVRPRALSSQTLVPAVGRRDRLLIAALSMGWLGCLVWFWVWWLQPGHLVTWVGLVINSVLLFYLSYQPIYFVAAVNRLRRVDGVSAVPEVRVAFVVTRAPSEPWAVARTTLIAMLAQEFPHDYDVWLCDEQPTEEITRWCEEHHVQISTRFGVAAYHRALWPRRTKCKEGNLAYFYDRVGYDSYDVVAQLDCDHVPATTYLAEMVRPFADPAVGYTAAPSVCDANVANSWAARGRLYCEANFHGPFQLGHNAGLAPICIGSHYAVRTRAIRDIGGIGPELAEDFSTSFLLNTAGWQGAFAIGAEAHGDGPLTFAAMLVQEFQWSRSLTTLLHGLVPRHVGRLPWLLRVRFLYVLLYYSLLAGAIIAGLALSPIAAVTGIPWVNVDYVGFLLHWWSLSAWLLLLTAVLRRRGLLRPTRPPIISWENWLYCLTRWPLIAWGVLSATLQRFRPRQITFKVTPKGTDGLEPLAPRLILPYVTISAVMAAAAITGELTTTAAGYVFLCTVAALTYAVVAFAVCLLHASEAARTAGLSRRDAVAATVRAPLLLAAGTLPLLGVALVEFPAYVAQVFGW
jgi:cellulose synthase/poly-beta-1,6-N-acetylglucosamine synthase-like glycosyltransferase